MANVNIFPGEARLRVVVLPRRDHQRLQLLAQVGGRGDLRLHLRLLRQLRVWTQELRR